MTTADVPSEERPADGESGETARLRAKLAFYESFDRVIAENIARSGDLLRQAMAMQSSASSEAEHQRAQDLSRQRALLSALLDDVIQLQGQAERLARRVADALDEVEAELPVGEPPADLAPVAIDSAGDHAPPAAAASRRLTIVVHRLPDPASARSLREHLASLDQVTSVEAREFAEGILRLEVTADTPLSVADLRRWPGAGGLDAVTERADLLEVRMPAGDDEAGASNQTAAAPPRGAE